MLDRIGKWVIFWALVAITLLCDLGVIVAGVSGAWGAFILYAAGLFITGYVLKVFIEML